MKWVSDRSLLFTFTGFRDEEFRLVRKSFMYGSSKMVDNLKVRPNSDSNISAAINPLPSSNHFHLSSVCFSCPFLSSPCGKIEKFSLKLEFILQFVSTLNVSTVLTLLFGRDWVHCTWQKPKSTRLFMGAVATISKYEEGKNGSFGN